MVISRKFAFLISVCVVSIFLNEIALAGNTFHVNPSAPNAIDSNIGTIEAPWKSIAKANSILSEGDTVYIHPGIYKDRIAPQKSGSEGKYISYKKSPDAEPWSVIISPSGYGASLAGNSYIELNGLFFKNTNAWIDIRDKANNNIITNCKFYGANSYGGFRLKNSFDNQILNNIFIDAPIYRLPFSPDAASCTSNDPSIGCTGTGKGWDQDCQDAWDTGGKLPSSCNLNTAPADMIQIKDGSRRTLIAGNTFGSSSHAAIDILYSDDNIIRDNFIENKYHTGVIVNGSDAKGSTARSLIDKNVFSNTGSEYFKNPVKKSRTSSSWRNPAIQLVGKYSIVRNNTITGGGTGIYISAYSKDYLSTSSYSRIYFNTVHNNLFSQSLFMNSVVEATGIKVINNIFSGAIEKDLANWSDYGNPVNFWINNIWTPKPNLILFKNTSSTTKSLDTLVKMYPYEFDSRNGSDLNFVADPLYNDSTNNDFTLKEGSPALEKGTWLATINSVNSVGETNSFTVTDSRFFFDGWEIKSEVGDVIKTQSGAVSTIQSINYEKNIITVNPPIKVENGEGLALFYKNSKPNIGAYGKENADIPNSLSKVNGVRIIL